MKKILAISVLLLVGSGLFAQETPSANEMKYFRFGLKFAPSINWYKPSDAQSFSKGKSKIGLEWGLQTEFRLNKIISLETGLLIDYDKATLNFTDTANYYYDTKNKALISTSDTAGKKYVKYKLNNRFYRTNYFTLPICLKMKTPQIGYITYYAEFGGNVSFRLKSANIDNVTQYGANNPTSDLPALDNSKEMNLIRLQGRVGGGLEYKLAGSTAVFFSLAYNIGISNALKKNSAYLFRNDLTPVVQKANSNNFALTVGILF